MDAYFTLMGFSMKHITDNDFDATIAEQVGKNICRLRRQAHLSQGELADKIGIRQGPLSNLENGKNLPSARVILQLSSILRVSTDQILSVKGSHEKPDNQTRVTFSQLVPVNPMKNFSDNTKCQANIEATIQNYLALEDLCKVPRRALIPLTLNFDATQDGMDRLATQVRTIMGIGSAIVFDPLELFENHGLRVIFMPLPKDTDVQVYYDALNMNLFIVISDSITPERQIFSLVYGLARTYIFTRNYNTQDNPYNNEALKAKLAKRFAACFLMPTTLVQNSVQQIGIAPDEWDFDMILRLKNRFGVSAQSFNYRLLQLGLITDSLQNKFREQIDSHYARNGFIEPDRIDNPNGYAGRIINPNGRFGDLLHLALSRNITEARAIENQLRQLQIKFPG